MPPDPAAAPAPGPQPTLFIDRDAWSRKLDEALRAAGIPFIAHRDLFADDTPDPVWLAEVGRQGWVVVTRDQNIRRRHNELAAVRSARIHLFALTSGNLSAADTAALVIRAWPAIGRAVAGHEPPALWSVTRGGEVRRLQR